MRTSEAWISRNLRTVFIAGLTIVVGWAVSPLIAAQSQPMTLLKRSEYLPAASQATMKLEQRERIAFFGPGRKGTKALTLVRINPDALRSKVITVELPDGKNYTFTGGLADFAGSNCWNGKIMRDGGIAAGMFICPGTNTFGEIWVDGATYDLQDNGDHQLLREMQQLIPKGAPPAKPASKAG